MSERAEASRGGEGRAALAGLALAALCAGAGCESLRTSALPEGPLWRTHPGTALSVTLRRPLTAGARQTGERYERGRPALDVLGRRVFVGSSDRGLYALSAEDGATLWRFETLGPVQGEPLYDPREDVVYFGSMDGALYKVRAENGELLWRFATNGEVSARPVLEGGTLFVMNANDTLLALDPATGRPRWTAPHTPAFGMEIAGYAGPAVAGGRVFAAYSDGIVTAYNALDGAEVWTPIDLAADAEAKLGETPKYLDVDTTPVPAEIGGQPVIYVGSYAGGVYALGAEDGAEIWTNDKVRGVKDLLLWTEPAHAPPGGVGPMVPERRILIASSGVTGLWALDPRDGRELWRRPLPDGGISAPVPVAGALLVTTSRYGIFLFSPLGGHVIDGLDTGGGISTSPVAFGTKAFMVTNGGQFLRVHVDAPLREGALVAKQLPAY